MDIGPSSWPPIETPKALRLGPCSEVEAAAAELNLKLVGGGRGRCGGAQELVPLRSYVYQARLALDRLCPGPRFRHLGMSTRIWDGVVFSSYQC